MNNFKLMVCPHDTAKNPENWYNFALYLTKTISASIHFEKSIDFPDFHNQLANSHLVYANPQDSLRLIKEHNYIPIARPSNLSDEIIFIANNKLENPKITDIEGKKITSVNSMMVTKVGLKNLSNKNITPSSISSKESWMAVVKAIFRADTDYAMVYKDFYEGLNKLSQSGLKKIGETNDGTIHHNLLISPELTKLADNIQLCLTEMHEDNDNGRKILSALNIEKLITVSKEDILAFGILQEDRIQKKTPTVQAAIETCSCC